jgi:arylsulfatase A-like enzyme
LSQEPEKVRDGYGKGVFGQGCLLARRLIERGVPFVEVSLSSSVAGGFGWDTHSNNFEIVKGLSAELDAGWSSLLADLAERRLLESTTVVWMGEFGRTPKFKGKGRDHYAKAWSTMLLGGGVKRGQVIGRTDAVGAVVEDRPVSVADFMATVCTALGVDPAKEQHLPDGRPLPIVEKGGTAIQEVFA